MAKPEQTENKIHIVQPAVHRALSDCQQTELDNATPESRLTRPLSIKEEARPTKLRTKKSQSRLEQVTRRMSLTILYTSQDNKAKDLPSIGWLTLEDEVSDGVWSKYIAMGKPEVLELWGCPLVDEIVSKSPFSNDDSRAFELTEKAFTRCEALLSAMMPLNWEVTFTSQKKRRPGVM